MDTLEQPKQLGQYLKELRQERGLSADQTARQAGCTGVTVSRIEQGVRRPSINLLWRLVDALDGNFLHAYSLLARDEGVPEAICSTISSGTPSSAQRAANA